MSKKVSFPPFDETTKSFVSATLNEFVTIDNPLDYHTFIWGDEDKLQNTFMAVLGGGFDVGMLILDLPTHPHMNPAAWWKTARAFRRASELQSARAVIVSSLHESMPLDLATDLANSNMAPMMGLDDCLTAFEAAAFIGQNWGREEPLPLIRYPHRSTRHPGEGRDPASNQALRHAESGMTDRDEMTVAQVMTEYEAKQLLKTFGLNIPEGRVCIPTEAVSIANSLGYPVAVKISSTTILHKTELGGVAVNLKTAAEVEVAASRMSKLGDELLIEKMVQGTVVELIVGLTRDPQFGLALVIGAGGIFTELLKDSITLLLPCSNDEILRALKKLKVWKLVEGFRGKSGDQAATIAAIQSIASFAAAYEGQIEELDVNPLFILPNGAIAADALIRMRKPT